MQETSDISLTFLFIAYNKLLTITGIELAWHNIILEGRKTEIRVFKDRWAFYTNGI